MAYRINDEIFFLKIDEQVEYLTQVINELYAKDIKVINTNINNLSTQINNLNETKQDKTSDELKTEVKNIVGSINELFDKIESETNRAVNSENEISTNLTEFENHVNPILESHTSSISTINDSIRSLQDNKQSKIDEQLQTTSKEIVGSINEVNKKINDSLYTVRIPWENFASSIDEATNIWDTFTNEEKYNLLNNNNCVIYPIFNSAIHYPLSINSKILDPNQNAFIKWLGFNSDDTVVGKGYLLCQLNKTNSPTEPYKFRCYKINRSFSEYICLHTIAVFNPMSESNRIIFHANIYDCNSTKITLKTAYQRIGTNLIVASGRFKSPRNIINTISFGPDNLTVNYCNNETNTFEYEDIYFNQSNISLSDTVFKMNNKYE